MLVVLIWWGNLLSSLFVHFEVHSGWEINQEVFLFQVKCSLGRMKRGIGAWLDLWSRTARFPGSNASSEKYFKNSPIVLNV